MNFSECIEYIESIPKFTVKNTPEVTRKYLQLLGDPDRGLKIFHIAGTNGKGSVSCYLSSVLRKNGYTAGMFISPHLVDIRERMSINGTKITEEEFTALCGKVIRVYEQNRESLPHPAYFEFLFLMGMLWFAQEKPDFVILETGLGGRLDASNSVCEVLISIITRIGLDHMQYLGETIPEIAAEKAGIIREGVPLVTIREPEAAFEVVRRKAREKNAEVIIPELPGENEWDIQDNGIDFWFRCGYDYFKVSLETGAVYQIENASLAIAALLKLEASGSIVLEQSRLLAGIREARWTGRMDPVLPDLVLDGGHNEDGIAAFLRSVSAGHFEEGEERILLFSAVRDKKYEEMLSMILQSGLFDRIIVTQLRTGRGVKADELKADLKRILQDRAELWEGVPVLEERENVSAMMEKFFMDRQPGKKMYYAAGSLYLVGEILEILSGRENTHSGFKRTDQPSKGGSLEFIC